MAKINNEYILYHEQINQKISIKYLFYDLKFLLFVAFLYLIFSSVQTFLVVTILFAVVYHKYFNSLIREDYDKLYLYKKIEEFVKKVKYDFKKKYMFS